MTDFDVDLFVIGGGSGGVRAARIAAGHGAKVMLAEEFRLGGACVIRGCVPKKLLVMASRFHDAFEDAAGFGWTVPEPTFDWPALVRAKEREITRLEGLYAQTQEKAGVRVVKSRAVLEDANTVRLLANGRRIRARHILIATGGRPNIPADLPGAEYAISSNEAFDLPVFPKRILIAGGGYIAVEFAGLFAGLGAEVTLIYRGENILRGFDEDMREGLRNAYEKRGIRFIFNDVFSAIEKTPEGLAARTKGGLSLNADQVMFAIGRSPNVEGLGLDKAGVLLGKDNEIPVDAFSCTNVANIHAVGDVTNRVNLTPVAIREGHAYADTVFGGKPWSVDHADIPTAVFSTPEIGAVGITEIQAKAAYAALDIYRTSFRPMKATLSGREERMIMKLIVDANTDRVVGVHILGEDAGEMAQLLGIAVKMKARKADFDATMALHPSAAEELVTMRTPSERWRRAG
ncbi:MAG: glutathione-disulfide reductase [Methylocystis sp.]|nr:glutathione-disulfide reductase [Methylocystis sp.]MCA3584253.1 glutathione-disulfide reductase [Methylocystis sp.]MCA3589133.1 glutathione-disulfide reductase [Methylocystis sp.]MCA3591422.1 glutathione-disulfide reductase [Methylocystis sp.]